MSDERRAASAGDQLITLFGRVLLIVGLLNLVLFAVVVSPNRSGSPGFGGLYQPYGLFDEPPFYAVLLLSLAAVGMPIVALVMGQSGRRMTIGHMLAYELIILCVLLPSSPFGAWDDWARVAAVPAVGVLLLAGRRQTLAADR